MRGFLQNLIATARQQRPVLRPRPISLFEGLSPTDMSTEIHDELPRVPQGNTASNETDMSHAAPAPRTNDAENFSSPVATPMVQQADSQPSTQAPPSPVAATQHTIIKVVGEVRAAAPAPVLQSAAVVTPVVHTASREAKPQHNPAQQTAAQPPKTTTQPVTEQLVKSHDKDTPPPALTRVKKSIVHKEHSVQHHHSHERVTLEKAATPRQTSVEHKPQPQIARPQPVAATPVPQFSQRPATLPTPLQSATAETQHTVHVSIGTVEIQAVSTPRPAAPRPRAATPQPMSLDDYLQQRNRESFE